MPDNQDDFPPRDKAAVIFDNGEGKLPLVMIIGIPIQAYAENMNDGTALLRGKLEEAKAVAMQELQKLRLKKAATGIIPGSGVKSPLTVH